ncbi:MAG: hypothetical protein IT434_06740 [Phycisphaerales bacterium]|jgi:hypothetical protein|nr:hypothetical protein [Phycisphaerales bacterium]
MTRPVTSRSERRSRRGVMLPAVMMIVVLVALIGATLAAATGAQAHGASASLSRRQARALAWSGVQAAMAEIADQRIAMLRGATPALTSEWTLFELGGRRGVVRLVSLDAEGDAIAEAARANVNTTPDEALRALVGPEADPIIAARRGGMVAAVESIDLSPPKGEGGATTGAGAGARPGSTSGVPGPTVGDAALPGGSDDASRADPRKVLTALSCDPDVQAGVGPGGDEHAGRVRINLANGWSKELGEQITARFGGEGAQAVERVMSAGTKFGSASDIVAVLRQLAVPEGEWGVLLDAYSAARGVYVPGRVDINRAGAGVLAGVPGMTPESAEAIVGARSRLSEESRALVTWPLTEGLVSVEQFQEAVDHITTRCLQWRVRIEAGMVVGGVSGSASSGSARDQSGTGFAFESSGIRGRDDAMTSQPRAASDDWSGRVVYEAVIDVAAERPRVAYLRDVTLDEIRHLMPGRPDAREPGLRGEPSGELPGEGPGESEPDGLSGGVPSSDRGPSAELDFGDEEIDAGLSLEGMDAEAMTSAIDAYSDRDPPTAPGAAPKAPERGDDRVGRWSTRGRPGGPGGSSP